MGADVRVAGDHHYAGRLVAAQRADVLGATRIPRAVYSVFSGISSTNSNGPGSEVFILDVVNSRRMVRLHPNG